MSGTADRGNLLDDFEHSTDSGGRAYSQAGWSGSAQSEKPRFLFSCMLAFNNQTGCYFQMMDCCAEGDQGQV